MRTLTFNASTAADDSGASPIPIIKIEVGGATGDLYYADRDLTSPIIAQGRVVKMNSLDMVLSDTESGGDRRFRIELQDADGVLKTIFENAILTGKRLTFLQHFAGLGESDMAPILSGNIQSEPRWREDDRLCVITVRDIMIAFRERIVGNYARRADFPKLGKHAEGTMLPIIYGEPHRVKAVLVSGGAQTELVRDLRVSETTLIVKDAARFPGGTITIRIGQEELTGSFSGNTFTITKRPKDIVASIISERSGRGHILRASSLPATNDNEYVGLFVKLTKDKRTQYRRIVQYLAATGTLVIDAPFVDGQADDFLPKAGHAFSITSLAAAHSAGETVAEVLDFVTYLISDAPVTSILGVEGWGISEPKVVVDGVTVAHERRGFVTLPATYYAGNINDTTTFPALGRAVATLRLPRLPTFMPDRDMITDEIFVTVRGRPKTGGGVLDNPADILAHLMKDIGGIATADIDATSFSAAATARADVTMAFALDRPRSLLNVIQDIAFQGRLAVLWESGKVRCRVLDNKLASSTITLDRTKLAAASAEIADADVDHVVTEITARYTHRGERIALNITDSAAEISYGRRTKALTFWAFEARHQVLIAAEWWLRRWRYPYRTIIAETFLPGLAIERHDVVTIDNTDLFAAPVKGRVTAIEHQPGHLEAGEIDRLRFHLQLPFWGGCTTGCEVACETGCEAAACEMSCTVSAETACAWSCEITCEEACQLACTASCEISCQGSCQLSCRQTDEAFDSTCQSACESGCETACESFGCETACESCCEASCESGVEVVTPIREVIILTPPATQYGAATVIEADREGNTKCPSFKVWDPFDTHPAAGDNASVYLNFEYQWVLIPSRRSAKYVRVGSASSGDLYNVQEQNHVGDLWGDTFQAWAVDSV